MPEPESTKGRLFVSYSRANKEQVYSFADALLGAGIDVWIDRDEIDPLDDFPARIRDGLAQCHALLAWYSPQYAASSYCQKELTAAWICAQRLTRDVLSRILILNPEEKVGHIHAGDVGAENYLALPKDASSRPAVIDAIGAKLAGLRGEFAAVREFQPPPWHPSQQQRSARFVGRLRELWAVHTALNPVGISAHENAGVVAQLQGLGGVGKTLLAVEYANRFGAAYPGGIHWLRAHGFDPNRPMNAKVRERERRRQIEDFALQYEVPIRDKDIREISRDLRTRLAAAAPYLWIVDDLPAGLDQNGEFQEWCAPSANGCTLVTTRSREYDGIGSSITIDVMDPESAVQLLTEERSPRSEEERKEAQGLAEDLGRHALALDVAGHFLLKTRDFAELREELARGGDPLGKLAAGLKGQLPGGHEKSIVATLVESLRVLGPEALNLLRLAGELDGGTPVPKRLAKASFQRAFALEEEAALDYYTVAVTELEMNSLAALSYGGAGGDACSIHSLVRYTMRHGDPARAKAASLRRSLRAAAVGALVELLRDVTDLRKHAALAMEVAHAKRLAPEPRDLPEALLAAALARYEGGRGNYREALKIAAKALRIEESALGMDHVGTLRARGDAAYWTGQTGKVADALRLYRELLADRERVLGRDHPDTLAGRSDVAYWTGRAGDLGEALRLFRALLPDEERVLGRDHPDVLTLRNNIASSTGQAGDAREALRLFRELLPDQIRLLGADHLDTLRTRNNIASWTGQLGNAPEALRLFRELLPDQERLVGKDHPHTLITRNNIGHLTGEAGDPREAVRLLRELLPERIRVLGPDHPDTLRTRSRIADWTAEAGDPSEALRLLRELLPDQQRELGPRHPDTLLTRAGIALRTGDTGDRREAIRLFQELLRDEEAVLGRDHPNTLTTRYSIAYFAGRDGATAEALRMLRELLADQVRALGNDHTDTLRTRKAIASCTAATDPMEALRLFRELLPDLERVLGRDNPNTLGVRADIAMLAGRTGDAGEAARLLGELLPDQMRVLGPDDRYTLATRGNLAFWSGEAGDGREALRLFRELLPDQTRVFGPDHPGVLKTRGNIAFWTGQTGDETTALRLFRDLLQDQERALGPAHPMTRKTREHIARLTGGRGSDAGTSGGEEQASRPAPLTIRLD